ncbi:hypothetical protein HMI55_007189 [Coelomomyces lativittatus]|nr:hypothetical protein HMI55_007189 [Coelomomyces lativittatus]
MVHLAWNLDGSALLVWMRTTLMDVLQIWTCSNYHWQLQQCMELASICHVQWDALIPLRLYVFTITKCFKYQFSFQILQSYQSKNASVCVIDTFHLRHTPFLHVNMPPPLSSSEISCELPLKAISFCQELENSEDLALITGWNTNEIILCHPSDETSRQIEIQSKYILSKSSNISLRQPLYLTKKLIVFLAYLIEEEVDALVTVELDTTSALSLSTPYLLSFYGYLLAPIPINEEECTEFCLQDTTGQVWKVQLGDDCTFGLRPWLQLPESQVDTMSVDSMGNLISLSGKARLYFNETMLCSNCLSYTLHSTHLFYTTLQHQLVCHRLHHSSTRSVELGAKLVVSNSTSVVLQMPRGNLETIYPRVLLMEALIHEFQAQHWLASFELCRRHRLDLNTLVDLNPVYFLENLTEFVTQLGQPTHLNLFLSHLKNEDTLRTFVEYCINARIPRFGSQVI